MNRRDSLKGILGLPLLFKGLLNIKPVVKPVVYTGKGLWEQLPISKVNTTVYGKYINFNTEEGLKEYFDLVKEVADNHIKVRATTIEYKGETIKLFPKEPTSRILRHIDNTWPIRYKRGNI